MPDLHGGEPVYTCARRHRPAKGPRRLRTQGACATAVPHPSFRIGALNDPGARYGAEIRGGQDLYLQSVDEPDHQVARAVAPQKITYSVTVVIAGFLDRPRRPDIAEAAGLHHLQSVHQPDRDVAGVIDPQNITLAVAVEIASAGNRPCTGNIANDRGLRDLQAVHQPDRNIAAIVAPQDVALAVAVEVRIADNIPVRTDIGDHRGLGDLECVHEPDRDVPGAVL